MAFKIQRQKQSFTHAGQRLKVGTHATCDLVLDDPLAADVHAILHLVGQGLEVEAQETSLGTYLDGEEFEGRRSWPLGSELILGATRLRFLRWDDEAHAAEIEVLERDFYFVDKRRGEFRSDADEWVRSEVRFGRMPALRRLNAFAGLLLLLGGLWLLLAPSFQVQKVLSPGPLTDVHADFFDQIHSAAGDAAALAALQADWGVDSEVMALGARGCNACHEGGKFEVVSCAGCHPDPVANWLDASQGGLAVFPNRHPFEILTGERSCLDCHREHDSGETKPKVDTDRNKAAVNTCKDCHGETQSAHELLPSLGAVLASNDQNGGVTYDPVYLAEGFSEFTHDGHVSRGISCGVCHPRAETVAGGKESLGEFTEILVEACFQCHNEGAAELSMPQEHRVSLTLAEHEVAGQACSKCHLEPLDSTREFVADLIAEPQGERAVLTYRIPSRPHAHQKGTVAGRECTECHLKPIEGSAGDRDFMPFSHSVHLHPLEGEGDDASQAFSAQCDACHRDVRDAGDLRTAAFAMAGADDVDRGTCNFCHQGIGGEGIEVRLAGRRDAAEQRTTMAHSTHVSAGIACVTCHGVAPGSLVENFAVTADCRDCHLPEVGADQVREHLNVGLESCSTCHGGKPAQVPLVFQGNSLAQQLAAAELNEGATSSDFSHVQHPKVGCASCHVQDDGDVKRVVIARGTNGYCQDCHVHQRFHWRAPADVAQR